MHLIFDIICIMEVASSCPVDVETGVIVGNEEPDPIEISDMSILYN